jgi:hypothetical protein
MHLQYTVPIAVYLIITTKKYGAIRRRLKFVMR